jgi:hypothetical protein
VIQYWQAWVAATLFCDTAQLPKRLSTVLITSAKKAHHIRGWHSFSINSQTVANDSHAIAQFRTVCPDMVGSDGNLLLGGFYTIMSRLDKRKRTRC